MNLHTKDAIRYLQAKHGFHISRGLGQNFIIDRGILLNILEGSGVREGDLVIEIGPGIGTLTAEIAGTGAEVIAVELDKRLIPVLRDTLESYENVGILNADILKIDLNEIIAQRRQQDSFNGNVRIIGNLPYYITTPIIMKLLEGKVEAQSLTFMVQKEVGDRIRAVPGTKAYGGLSIAAQYYCKASKVIDVPAERFFPRPKVDSQVINLMPREERPAAVNDERIFFECVKAGFGKRRKTLRNSMDGVCGLTREEAASAFEASGIDSSRRAETLTIEEFARLSNAFCEVKGSEI